MINLLTKICDYVKLLLSNDQKPALLSTTLPDHETTTWEEVSIVSSSVNVPPQEEEQLLQEQEEEQPMLEQEEEQPMLEQEEVQPLQEQEEEQTLQEQEEDKEVENNFIIEAFKSLTPEYLLILSEMRNLLNSDLEKIVFYALTTQSKVEVVATHLDITPLEVKKIFQDAIRTISIQTGFVRQYLNNGVQKDMEIDLLKSTIESLKKENIKQEKPPVPKVKYARISYTKQKALLKKPLYQSLTLETRTKNVFLGLDIETLEDLLRYIQTKGMASLTTHSRFGVTSLKKLEDELIRKGIFNRVGYCALYKELEEKKEEKEEKKVKKEKKIRGKI